MRNKFGLYFVLGLVATDPTPGRTWQQCNLWDLTSWMCDAGWSCVNRTCMLVNHCGPEVACGNNAKCKSVTNGFVCECNDGFTEDPDTRLCVEGLTTIHPSACASGWECSIILFGEFCYCPNNCFGNSDPCSIAAGNQAKCITVMNGEVICVCLDGFEEDAVTGLCVPFEGTLIILYLSFYIYLFILQSLHREPYDNQYNKNR